MDVTEVSVLHHIGLALLLLWILSSFGISHPLLYFISFVYLYQVNEHYTLRLRRRVRFKEKKQASQKRVLSDSETVRWLNHAVEKIWPICMEQITSQKILLPIVPWFLDKYKPWTAEEAVVQHLYLGRNPPMFTEIRVLRESTDDDHLVLELGMNFLTADDMSAILAVKLRKSVGFGIWAKMHITCMHIEGRVLVGVKFLRDWPFLGRLRVCFVEPPYFQMTAKPLFSHGLDVTELPGISGWLDKILAVAFEQTLVEPNMLVVDVEKFASTSPENWFSMLEKQAIAFAKVEVIEAADMKAADLNGLSDPYVKGKLGTYQFRTKIQKKTLAPKWQEEFKIPIHTWESPNVLLLEVFDKDRMFDDSLGDCSVNISDLRGGQRHDKWLPLQNIKMGRLHLAVTVLEDDGKEGEHLNGKELLNEKENANASESEVAQQDSTRKASERADEFESINIEGQQQTGIWVHHPGSNVSQTWEPRKREGKGRRPEVEILKEDTDSVNSPRSVAAGSGQCDSSSESENLARNRVGPLDTIKRGLHKIGSVFQRSPRNGKGPRNESPKNKGEAVPSPHINVHAIGEKGISVKFVCDDENSGAVPDQNSDKEHREKELGANFVLDGDNSETIEDEKSDKGSAEKEIGVNFVVHDDNSGALQDQNSDNGSLIPIKAGKSAQSLKHTLSRKDSYKSKEVPKPSAVTSADLSVKESLSSSEEYSPIIEEIPIESSSVASSSKGSPSDKEEIVQPVSSVSPRVTKEPLVRKVSFQGGEMASNVAGSGESLAYKRVSSQDAEKMNDDVEGHAKSPDRKLSNQGSGRMDETPADDTNNHVEEVPKSLSLNISEESSEAK
ncbi:C2 domain-containing protein [Cinnamomum micranthum f. kanehirae]|uniref:C2 domain-containing protein n=1 Tax=Cinnamomum micranthum f. kanehirae TaxID=337451 RepID=A0A443Q324_9MAGN|nr:C2 domain-containing protein [Cinnamomum micranthum f. kanehirae]